jgi:antitoxin (DNA-binding transcriptional repressor) of toxin-antitoxin stability system
VSGRKTHLSRLLRGVEDGEEVVIERDGQPVARLVRIERPRREFGQFAGEFHVPDDFDDPLPDELQRFFE